HGADGRSPYLLAAPYHATAIFAPAPTGARPFVTVWASAEMENGGVRSDNGWLLLRPRTIPHQSDISLLHQFCAVRFRAVPGRHHPAVSAGPREAPGWRSWRPRPFPSGFATRIPRPSGAIAPCC